LMMGAGTIFFAYIGFDAVSTAAQECKDPQKDMPIGIIGSLAVCTVPPTDPAFEARRYWRGPVWAHINWLVVDGMERSGLKGEAAELRRETLDLIRRSGFAEYFDPITGTACGADAFSWTAALALDLLSHELSD